MGALPRIVSVAQLQRDPVVILQEVRGSDRPFVVTMSDDAVAVLLAVDTYEDLVENADRADEQILAARFTDDAATLSRVGVLLPTGENFTMAEAERAVTLERLQKLGGNRTRTAESLGIGLRTLQRKIRQYKRQGFALPTSDYDDDSA